MSLHCGHRSSDRVRVRGLKWCFPGLPPEPHVSASGSDVVGDLGALLRRLDLRHRGELGALLDDYVDGAWIDWENADEGTLIVALAGRGIGLAYPFPLTELWATLDELEETAGELDVDVEAGLEAEDAESD